MDLPQISGETWALASGLFWAAGVVLFARAGESIAPLPLNLFKDVVALVFLAPLVWLLGGRLEPAWDGRTWVLVAASGVLGITMADTLFFMALNRLGAGLNAIVDCLYYPSMVLVAFLALDEVVVGRDLLGGAMAVAGVLLASLGRPRGVGGRRAIAEGVTFGALGMLLVALGVALIDGVLRSQRVLDVTAWRLLFGTLALLPLNLLSPGRRQAVSRLARPGPLWRHAVPAAVLGGALAMWAWLAGFAAADLSRAAVLNQLSTVWIYLLAVLFLGEALTARGVLALSLAFGGALLVMTG